MPLTAAPIASERPTEIDATDDQLSVEPGAASLSAIVTVAGDDEPTAYAAFGAAASVTVSGPSTAESSTGRTDSVALLAPAGIITDVPRAA